MSAEAMGWVYRHSPFKGAKFAVHMAIADSVNDQHDNELWLTQRRLAEKARVSRDAANKALQELVAKRYLKLLEDNSAAGKANRYRFLFPAAAEVVYESRHVPEGAVGDDTPPVEGVQSETTPGVVRDDTRVQSETTPLSSGTTPGAVGDDTEPKGTQGQPNGSASPRSAAQRAAPVVVETVEGLEVEVDPSDPAGSFEVWWSAYPRHQRSGALGGGGRRKVARDRWRKLSTPKRAAALAAVGNYRAHLAATSNYPLHAEKWLSTEAWGDYDRPPASGADGLDEVAVAVARECRVDVARATGQQRGDLVTAAAAIVAAGGDVQTVADVAGRYRTAYEGAAVTPGALVKHWAKFVGPTGGSRSVRVCGRCRQPLGDRHSDESCGRVAALFGGGA